MIETQWYYVASFIVMAIGLYAGIMKQFSDFRKQMYDGLASLQREILNKLEYHERHDDSRFEQLTSDIWQLRLNQVSGNYNGSNQKGARPLRRKTEEERTS